MALADGIQSGVSWMVDMNRMALLKAEDRRKQELFPEQMKQVKLETQLLEHETDPLTLDMDRAYKESMTERYRGLNEAQLLKNKSTKNIHNWSATLGILEDMEALATNPELDKILNTNLFDTWASITMGSVNALRDDGLDLISLLDHKTFKAHAELAPIVESGDFDSLTEHGSALTQVFRGDLQLFLGKKFKDPDLEGEIVDVKFTGVTQALPDGENALVEAEYTVLDNEGNRKKKIGFLPDVASETVSSEIAPDDAKAASLKDVIDKFGAGRQIVYKALQNPKMIDIANRLATRQLRSYYPPDADYDRVFMSTQMGMVQSSALKYTVGMQAVNRLYDEPPTEAWAWDETTGGHTNVATTHEYLSAMKAQFPEQLHFNTTKDGRFRLEKNQSIYDVYALLQISHEEAGEILKAQATVPQQPTGREGLPELPSEFTFSGQAVPSNTNRDVYINTLNSLYGTGVVTEQVSLLEQEFISKVGRPPTDIELLDQLHIRFSRR